MNIINKGVKSGEGFRAKYLSGVFKLLTKLKITPNFLTFFRFIAGPAFVFTFPEYPRFAVVMIVVASLMDSLDGGLARYQNISSDRGKFWDVLVDHLNYVFPVFTLLMVGQFNSTYIGYQLLIVPVLYLLATLKESEGEKTDWIIHPYYTTIYFKPFAILAIVLLVFFQIDWINNIFLLLNITMSIMSIYFVGILLRRWR